MNSCRRLPCFAISSAMACGDLGPVDGVDRVEQRDGLLGLVGLQRADQVQRRCRDSASRSAGHLALASCTRFSPNRRWPASRTGWMCSAPNVLVTAIEMDGGRVALGVARGGGDAGADGGEVAGGGTVRGHLFSMGTLTISPTAWVAANLPCGRALTPVMAARILGTAQSAREISAYVVRIARCMLLKCSPILQLEHMWSAHLTHIVHLGHHARNNDFRQDVPDP